MMTNELVLLTIVVLMATMLQLWREHTWRARLLEARADQQHHWALEGDPRGTYGQDATPSPQPMAIPKFAQALRAGWQAGTGARREHPGPARPRLQEATLANSVEEFNRNYEYVMESVQAALATTKINTLAAYVESIQEEKNLNTTFTDITSVPPRRTSTQTRTSVPSVPPGEHVVVRGSGCGLYVRGDVGAGARLHADGAESYIHIDGNVGHGARVQARGSHTTIYIRGHTDPTATISAEGANAHIAMGRNRTDRETTRS